MAELKDLFRNKAGFYVGRMTKNHGSNMAGDIAGFEERVARHLLAPIHKGEPAIEPVSKDLVEKWTKEKLAWEEPAAEKAAPPAKPEK